MIGRWSIRWKMTVWYIAALSVILSIFSGLMLAMMRRQLHERIDNELREEARELSQDIASLKSEDEIRRVFSQRYREHGNFSFQINRNDGTILCGNPWLRAHPLAASAAADGTSVETLRDILLGQSGAHRMLIRPVANPSIPLMIQALAPYSHSEREFLQFVKILCTAGGIALLAACASGLVISGRALAPLERIICAAERMSAENLSISIAVDNPQDELGRLATTLNNTFQRLRDSVQRIQRFTSDAAHELRTPLSVLRTRLEVAMRLPVDAEQYHSSCRVAIDQAEKLTMLIDQLLVLCRHDAGLLRSLHEEVYVKPLIEDVVEILHAAATAKKVSLTIADISNAVVSGDDISLSRVFFNLIENAIKYTQAGGSVVIEGTCDNRYVRLAVTDTGVGIAPVHLTKVFNRFYRIDPSRSDQTGGSGLGLAICHSILDSHQGDISVQSIVGKGSTFTVVLPLISESATIDTSWEDSDAQVSRPNAKPLSTTLS